MQEYFLVPIMDFDPSWSIRGFMHYEYGQQYCQHVLKIPEKNLQDAALSPTGLRIRLTDTEQSINEPWYLQLKKLATRHGR